MNLQAYLFYLFSKPFLLLLEVVKHFWFKLPFSYFKKLWRARKTRWSLRKRWKELHSFTHKEIGDIGESLAERYLRSKGYLVLYRNFLPREGGEIDLICRQGKTLVFVEVKTRVSPRDRRPLLAINTEKRLQLLKGARQYLALLQKQEDEKYPPTMVEVNLPTRFDAVEVVLVPNQFPELTIVQSLYMEV